MTSETVGNLLLAVTLIASGILFIAVNLNYLPESEDEEDETR